MRDPLCPEELKSSLQYLREVREIRGRSGIWLRAIEKRGERV